MGKMRASFEEVEGIIQEIRDFHALGRKSLTMPSCMSIEKQAMKLGCKSPKLGVARRFASPKTGYTKERLDELCDVIMEYRPMFGTSHVEILIAIPWPKRAKFQSRCVRRNWSLRRLKAAKTKRMRPKSKGGRRPDVTASNAVVELKYHSNAVCRLIAQLKEPRDGEPSIFDQLPEWLRHRVEAVISPTMLLRKTASVQLKKTQQPE